MTDIAKKIQAEALQLSETDRAELASALLSSLEIEHDAEAAWDTELERRLERIESGDSKGRPIDDVLSEIRAKHL